ncbi:DUF4097 family beta strand repeat-containing protein [Ekhidna sp. MALMAid0563]|uniref:DUF4097 family beta strand repeat-containing protein n=1 Tax=Ekhidna sp. MALMAid0563 TaxID=3143937 RepID=UPI0032DE69AE
MKTIIAGLILLVSATVVAQDKTSYNYPIKGNAGETWLVIENLSSDLQIEGTSGSEIRIESKNYKGLPEKAKGLKPLSATGPENTGVGLSIKQEGNTISLSGAHREADNADYVMYLPKNLKVKLDYNSWQAGDVIIKGMAGEIEAKSQVGDLEFIDVTGPIVAHTLSSDLEVSFTSLSSTSPTSLSSTSGDIDVTLPASVKGTFKMSTISGGVYTAFDFDFGEDANIRRVGGQKAEGKLNGGGVEVSLKTVSGDIYIRKAE